MSSSGKHVVCERSIGYRGRLGFRRQGRDEESAWGSCCRASVQGCGLGDCEFWLSARVRPATGEANADFHPKSHIKSASFQAVY